MLVYTATKQQFLFDVQENAIHSKVLAELKRRLRHSVAPSEIDSWRNSMQFIANILVDQDLPATAGVSIEYQLQLSSKRIDFILSGQDAARRETAVIIELKQWSEVAVTAKDAVVRTWLGRGLQETAHPSYQAWSYAELINDFNETVRHEKIALVPCAYLHNLDNTTAVNDVRYASHIARAPVFISKDARKLSEFLKKHVRYGDSGNLMYRIENGRIRPSKSLADCLVGMMAGNREFVLVDDQKVVFETALDLAHRAQPVSKTAAKSASSAKPVPKQVLIVEGGPGTGKSVVAINLLVELTNREMLVQYVSKNAAPRAVYSAILSQSMSRNRISNLFRGSGSFVDTDVDYFDALLVDEAHRLNEFSGLYSNLGENQIKEIVRAAKLSVFFIDEDQRVTLKDIGSKDEIRRWAGHFGAEVVELKLSAQFRCNGSDAYLAWLDNVLQCRETANQSLDATEFEFRVFDDPKELRRAIEAKNLERNKARLVAGYCWKWASKSDDTAMDVVIPEHSFRARWNLDSDGSLWAIAPESVSEVGCIHTSQGLELDYVGVIVGPDLVVRGGKVVCDPSKRSPQDQSIRGYKRLLADSPVDMKARLDTIIKNTYRTLMTRAQKGCYMFCTDPETNQYFKERLGSLMEEQPSPDATAPALPELPFKIVPPHLVRPYINAVPVFDVKIAAGAFSDEQAVEDRQWIELPDHIRIQRGHFVAQVVGESMNREIPNGAWCLFRANPAGSRQGKIVLVEHRGISDPEMGGRYTVKRYFSEKVIDHEDTWRHRRIVLRPESTDEGYSPLELAPDQSDELRVLGVFLGTLS